MIFTHVSVPSRGTGKINEKGVNPGSLRRSDCVSVPSRGTGKINGNTSGCHGRLHDQFPSPLGEQGKSTVFFVCEVIYFSRFPSPLGEQGKSTRKFLRWS